MGFSIGLWKAIWSKDKIIGFHENIDGSILRNY